MKAAALLTFIAVYTCSCGRKSSAASSPIPGASASTVEWSSERDRFALGMTLRTSGAGKGSYKLQGDGCVRVTYRPANARVVLVSGVRNNEGEDGASPASGPICGVRGDEWAVEAAADATWALWATDSDK